MAHGDPSTGNAQLHGRPLAKIAKQVSVWEHAMQVQAVPFGRIFDGGCIGGFKGCCRVKFLKNQLLAATLALQVQNI
jgi:hypothetical protein